MVFLWFLIKSVMLLANMQSTHHSLPITEKLKEIQCSFVMVYTYLGITGLSLSLFLSLMDSLSTRVCRVTVVSPPRSKCSVTWPDPPQVFYFLLLARSTLTGGRIRGVRVWLVSMVGFAPVGGYCFYTF